MALKIEILHKPESSVRTFLARAKDGTKFAIDTASEYQADLAIRMLQRHIADYDAKETKLREVS